MFSIIISVYLTAPDLIVYDTRRGRAPVSAPLYTYTVPSYGEIPCIADGLG